MDIKIRVKELRHVKAKDLYPNERNWRKHPEVQQKAMRGILEEVGFAGAVLARERADGSLEIIDGHLRQELMPEQEVPVLVTDLSEAEALKVLASFDPISTMIEYDTKKLEDLLAEVKFDNDDVQKMVDQLEKDAKLNLAGETTEDVVPEPQAEAITKPGDLWILGEHRLLCGDSTKKEDVERTTGTTSVDVVLTDPPYGINQPGVPHDTPEENAELINQAIAVLPISNGVVVAFQSTRMFPVWLDAIRKHGFTFHRILSLYKEAQCTYPWRGWILKTESILVASVGEPRWNDIHPYVHDVYRVSEVSGELADTEGWHGSVKPLAVVVDILQRICKVGDAVFDPFLGSGTTLIAAEQLGRRCYGLEISPQYCDVIVKRWENLTGKKATLQSNR